MTTTAEMTIGEFSVALSAQTSTPGGGGAAAVTSALAASLLSMVINFTLGKKKYADVQAEMASMLERTETLRLELLALADADVEAFSAVAATYTMPRESDEEKAARTMALQEALKGATRVPFVIAERALDVLKFAAPVAEKGNANVVSDAATAINLAHSALLSAIVNVDINLNAIKDESFVGEWGAKRDALMAEADLALAVARRACATTLGLNL
jgi:formiminotetrahydrofolate cyclodeaminase